VWTFEYPIHVAKLIQRTSIGIGGSQSIQKLVEGEVSIAKVEFDLLQDLGLKLGLIAVLNLGFAHSIVLRDYEQFFFWKYKNVHVAPHCMEKRSSHNVTRDF
jgi:hypothetical protein